MLTTEDIAPVLAGGGHVVAADGKAVGRVQDVFLGAGTGQPAWVAVLVGRLRHRTVLVPLDDAGVDGDAITVPYDAKLLKHAPDVTAPDGRLSPDDEATLRAHYVATGTDHLPDHDPDDDPDDDHDDHHDDHHRTDDGDGPATPGGPSHETSRAAHRADGPAR
ncbi:PRC-barrel domain-containing protein [Cellulomonas marina]|uniref:PRC-barrel domain-containing protein n=1 Tax=Cellulomonas marina TaxID=988821 RepID=A0A1I1AFE1_9CELL|nr:PRC-barrel domain-containing protein [Cellulomonas marina]GIG29707.1 hypothetical protein Cma02nite_23070 [Cellulomonas marina]SFB36076.1 PRC-barrel domain-containing protein [Cellulomonas marina]